MTERRVDLEQGPVYYQDLGEGDVTVVFIHGVLVNGTLWREVAPRVAHSHRCIVPDWPLGAHRVAMRPDADLSVTGLARLVADFLEALDLQDVVLVGNDSGGAVAQLVAADHPERVARLALTPCDAFEIFPPRRFAYLSWVPRIPGLTALLMKSMLHLSPLRNLPISFGALSRCRIPQEVLEGWVRPAAQSSGVRRDLGAFLRSVAPALTLGAAERLRGFAKPALLLWAANPFFPLSLASRLQRVLGDAELVEIPEAGVFIPEDQPERVAAALSAFAARRARTSSAPSTSRPPGDRLAS